jgi:hypothetical protein
MKSLFRILSTLILLCGLSFSQVQIIYNQQLSPPRQLLTNFAWGSLNQAVLVYFPSNFTTGSCFTFTNNNTTSAHALGIQIWTTTDPNTITVSPVSVSPAKWVQIYTNTLSGTIPAASSLSLYVPIAGATQVALVFPGVSAAGAPDTVSIAQNDTFQQGQCNNNFYKGVQNGADQQSPCGSNINVIPTASGTTSRIQSVPTISGIANLNARWHICSYAITGNVATTSATLTIGFGDTATTCGTISSTWAVVAAAAFPVNFALSAGNGELFSMNSGTLVTGAALCYKDGGTTTGTTIAISYDYY